MTEKIPHIIHYCWFGGKEKPQSVLSCIESWRRQLPDYQIIEWSESNFDIENAILYVKQAYYEKKWAFVSDYVRLCALYDVGGIYLDTDVRVFRPLDSLLVNHGFLGFESNDYVGTAVMAFEKGSWLIKEMMGEYLNRQFIDSNGIQDLTSNVILLKSLLVRHGLTENGLKQAIGDVVIYPQFMFYSNDILNIFDRFGSNIYAYHYNDASWYGDIKGGILNKTRHYIIGKLRNLIGTDFLLHHRIRGPQS